MFERRFLQPSFFNIHLSFGLPGLGELCQISTSRATKD